MCEKWVGDWTETATYCHPVPLPLAVLLSRSAGLLSRGPSLLRAGSHCLKLQQVTSKLKLSVALGYIIVWPPPASCGSHICTQFNSSTVKVIPWYLRPDAPVPWSTLSQRSICYTYNKGVQKTGIKWVKEPPWLGKKRDPLGIVPEAKEKFEC